MTREHEKVALELAIFASFANRMNLGAEDVRNGDATKGEPDILCTLQGEGEVAYELAEACAPEFAEAETRARKDKDSVAFAWGNDVSEVTIRNKLQKTYCVQRPLDLLLYTNGRTALPDDVITDKIIPLLAKGLGPFRRVWFMGDEVVELSRRAS
jgi:hypothetical protein